MGQSRKKSKPKEVHTLLGLKVKDFNVRVASSLNPDLRDPRYGFYSMKDPAYQFFTDLKVLGETTYPEEREGEEYSVWISGKEINPGEFSLTLEDFQARDEYGVPKWRTYHGREIPVFEETTSSLGFIERPTKRRPTGAINAWLAPQVVSDCLTLLSSSEKALYLEVHELKVERRRRLLSLDLQTNDPAEE
jgi:hypothetical protein